MAAVTRRRAILWTLVQRDLRVRYSRSLLGYVWTVLDPLLMASVYFVVFTFIFKAGGRVADKPYFLYLLSGLLAWQWFTGSVNDTAKSLIQEARLVRSTNLPREIWVIRCVVAKGVEFVLSLPVLVGFVLYYLVRGRVELDWELVFFPLGMLLQFVLLVGLGLLLAPVTVLATDMQRVVRIVLRFLFYLSPVLYGTHAVPEPLRVILVSTRSTASCRSTAAACSSAASPGSTSASAPGSRSPSLVLGFWTFARLERTVLKEI